MRFLSQVLPRFNVPIFFQSKETSIVARSKHQEFTILPHEIFSSSVKLAYGTPEKPPLSVKLISGCHVNFRWRRIAAEIHIPQQEPV